MKQTEESKPETLAAILCLAEQLGVNLGDHSVAITPQEGVGQVRMYDGSLEATLHSYDQNRIVVVESPRAPGIRIELVDHRKDLLAPKDAIYSIMAYTPKEEGDIFLNGDVGSIYVGREGLMLSGAGKKRAYSTME